MLFFYLQHLCTSSLHCFQLWFFHSHCSAPVSTCSAWHHSTVIALIISHHHHLLLSVKFLLPFNSSLFLHSLRASPYWANQILPTHLAESWWPITKCQLVLSWTVSGWPISKCHFTLLCQIRWRSLVLVVWQSLAGLPLSLAVHLSPITALHLSRSSAPGLNSHSLRGSSVKDQSSTDTRHTLILQLFSRTHIQLFSDSKSTGIVDIIGSTVANSAEI